MSALHLAALKGHAEIVKILVNAGANVDSKGVNVSDRSLGVLASANCAVCNDIPPTDRCTHGSHQDRGRAR